MVEEDNLREMRREIEEIRDRITDISHVQSLQARADGRVEELVLSYFRSGATETKVGVYLSANDQRSGAEIAAEVGVDPAQVSRYTKQMTSQKWGILGFRWDGNRKVFHYTPLEAALNLSGLLRDLVND